MAEDTDTQEHRQAVESAPDLGALVASPHWVWRPGMRDLSSVFGPRIILAVYTAGRGVILSAHEDPRAAPEATTVRTPDAFTKPDIDHGGTQGEMLALVRKAWAGWDVAVSQFDSAQLGGNWPRVSVSRPTDHGHSLTAATLGLALAAALLAAPTPVDAREREAGPRKRYPIGANGLCTVCDREVCEHTTEPEAAGS
jgi:hypothetical protein